VEGELETEFMKSENFQSRDSTNLANSFFSLNKKSANSTVLSSTISKESKSSTDILSTVQENESSIKLTNQTLELEVNSSNEKDIDSEPLSEPVIKSEFSSTSQINHLKKSTSSPSSLHSHKEFDYDKAHVKHYKSVAGGLLLNSRQHVSEKTSIPKPVPQIPSLKRRYSLHVKTPFDIQNLSSSTPLIKSQFRLIISSNNQIKKFFLLNFHHNQFQFQSKYQPR
jgi:hypothetical protein